MDKKDVSEIVALIKGVCWKGLRPWGQLFDYKKFQAPPTAWNKFEKHVAANFVYFAGNYMWIYLITLLLWQMFSPLMLFVSVFGLVLVLVALRPPAAAHNFLKKMVASTGIKFLQSDGAMEKARIYLVLFLLVLLLVPLGGLYSTLLAWLLPLLLLVAHACTRQVPAGVEQVKLRYKSAPTLGNWLSTMGGGAAPGTGGGPAKVAASHAGPGQGVGGGTVNAPGFGSPGGVDPSRGGADAEGAFVGDGGAQAEAGVAPVGPTPGFGGSPAVPLGGNPEDGLRARGNSQH